jgi:integration host factor subunit beta
VTKRQLIDELTQRYARFSRKEAAVMVNAMFEAMLEALQHGERIELRGFGIFTVKERPARKGRNPKTSKLVTIPAKRLPVFKATKALRYRVNGNKGNP